MPLIILNGMVVDGGYSEAMGYAVWFPDSNQCQVRAKSLKIFKLIDCMC